MQYYCLNKDNNEKLIVFFCGWSFDEQPFKYLKCADNDILIVYDYSQLDLCKEQFAGYKNYSLICWSMGVYVAYILREQLPKFSRKIAVNGTPFPIDDELGIPQRTFDLTLKYVDSGLKGKFQQNLFKNPKDYETFLLTPVKRSLENRAEELVALNNFIRIQNVEYSKFYDYAIIGDTDKIIPTRNQIRCWEKYNTPIKMLDTGHFPFYEFNSWVEILDKCS